MEIQRTTEQGEVEKQQQGKQSTYNHGVKWFRGSMIAKGGFGSVYLATLKKPKSRNSYFPKVMAVKSAEVSVSGSLQKEKEVLISVVGCPSVLKCFGEEITTQESGDMVYNVLLEYASGGTLAGLIKKSNGYGLPESDVKAYTRFVLKGLKHIHDCGYVHCDLKPENILLVPSTSTGSASKFLANIGDFGLAKRAMQGNKRKRKLDPYLRGTTMYMAPEAVVDHIQEPPSDIWALGCVVLEMLTGKQAWSRKPDFKTEDLLRLISDEYELPKIPTEISKEARLFLKGCFVRKPMFRLTAEMLLNCPFVASIGDEVGEAEGLDEVTETEGVSSSCLSFENSDEFDSADWGFISEEDSSSYSWSEDAEEEVESSAKE